MNDIKKLGRPRKFDRDIALEQAMTVFWEKGYDGASMRDLTGAMGVTGPSIYAAFGDKRELFLETIDHYCAADACTPLFALEGEDDIATALHAFLAAVIDSATQHESGAKGCFLASSVTASVGQIDGVAEKVERAIAESEARIAARFEREIGKGTLPEDFPAQERAAILFDLRQGYMFRGRAGVQAEQLRKDIPRRVQMILAH